MAGDRIYLDHAATTPVLAEARAAMTDALDVWANPSSPHAEGRGARAAFEAARTAIAEALGWRHDVILSSGASEAIAICAASAKAERSLIGATEHDAVVAAMGTEAQALAVDEQGRVELAELERALAGAPALVAVQQVNNETGLIQPIAAIAAMVRTAGSLLLTDCAQGAGKIPLPDADFFAVSAHKLGGPPGMGAVLVRDINMLTPSGGQEKGYRRGTENLPAAAGFAAAVQSRAFVDAMPRLAELRSKLEEAIVAGGGTVVAADSERIATIGAYAMPGVSSASQLVQFDLAGIGVSAGSACSSGSMKPSRVLAAMCVPAEIAGTVIRVSFGPQTSEDDVDRFVTEWHRIAGRAGLRAA
ncbi:MAG: aminotransferase class V-fold PLP-dependent enzyme [Sphingomicrobium sp.]